MPSLLLVMLGGAFGSGARHLVGRVTLSLFGPNYPWGTLAVNLIGGLLMGLLAGGLMRFGENGEQWRLLLGVGVLGGFTTFSAFSLDVMNMLQRGDWGTALGYVLVSVIVSIVALWAGMQLVKAIA
jgi:CrcB protein